MIPLSVDAYFARVCVAYLSKSRMDLCALLPPPLQQSTYSIILRLRRDRKEILFDGEYSANSDVERKREREREDPLSSSP